MKWINGLIIVTVLSLPFLAGAEPPQPSTFEGEIAALEASSGGRLGFFGLNMSNQMTLRYRPDERFPLASTFKLMAVSAVLKQSMLQPDLLSQKVNYTKEDLVEWSPITEKNLAQGMTVSDLCAAAMMYSDNTAINLLMKKMGGPATVTAFARSIGNNAFRLDRWETELNTALPGDVRDTTTPSAMAHSLQFLVLGHGLAKTESEQLQSWLKGNTMGNTRIRAGVPTGWIVGDKTGSANYGTTNDIGILWPPQCQPIIVAIYFTQNEQQASRRDDLIASATRIMLNEFAKTDQCIKPLIL